MHGRYSARGPRRWWQWEPITDRARWQRIASSDHWPRVFMWTQVFAHLRYVISRYVISGYVISRIRDILILRTATSSTMTSFSSSSPVTSSSLPHLYPFVTSSTSPPRTSPHREVLPSLRERSCLPTLVYSCNSRAFKNIVIKFIFIKYFSSYKVCKLYYHISITQDARSTVLACSESFWITFIKIKIIADCPSFFALKIHFYIKVKIRDTTYWLWT